MADPERTLFSQLCWCPRVTQHGDEVPASHRWAFNPSVSSRMLLEKWGEPPEFCWIFATLKLELNVQELPAGWVLLCCTSQSHLTNKEGCFGSGGEGIKFTLHLGEQRGPGLSFPAGGSSGVGIPDLGCYFPVLLLLFPKMDVFPPLVHWKCELCRVLSPNPETAGLGSSCAVKLLALLFVFACLLFPFCITFSLGAFLHFLHTPVKRTRE